VGWEGQRVSLSALAFDVTGARLFTVARNTEAVQIWDVANGTLLRQLDVRAGPITKFHVTPDGTRVVIGSRHTLQIWSLISHKHEHTLAIDANEVLRIAMSHDGKLLSATMYDGSVGLWELESGTQVAGLQGHSGAVWSVAFDPAGARVVTGGADQTAIVWRLRDAALTKVIALDALANSFELRGDRLLVVTNLVTVRRVSDGKILAERPIGPNGDARFVHDHEVAILDREGRLWLWNLDTGAARAIARHARPGDWVTSAAGAVACACSRAVSDVTARSSSAVRRGASRPRRSCSSPRRTACPVRRARRWC